MQQLFVNCAQRAALTIRVSLDTRCARAEAHQQKAERTRGLHLRDGEHEQRARDGEESGQAGGAHDLATTCSSRTSSTTIVTGVPSRIALRVLARRKK